MTATVCYRTFMTSLLSSIKTSVCSLLCYFAAYLFIDADVVDNSVPSRVVHVASITKKICMSNAAVMSLETMKYTKTFLVSVCRLPQDCIKPNNWSAEYFISGTHTCLFVVVVVVVVVVLLGDTLQKEPKAASFQIGSL